MSRAFKPSALEILQAVGMRRTRRCLPPIPCLLALISPSAIFGRIRAVIVNAVDGVGSGRSTAHIGIKGGKVIEPSGAHVNTTPSILSVLGVVRVCASLLHGNPRLILGRLAEAVRNMALTAFTQTPARFCMAAKPHNLFVSAIADGMPVPLKANVMRWALQSKAAHAFACPVFSFWPRFVFHERIYTTNFQPWQVYV